MPLYVVIPVTTPLGVKADFRWGSILHGAFMDRLPADVATRLHASELKPWTQHMEEIKTGSFLWVVSALSCEIEDILEKYLLQRLPMQWTLKQKGFQITLEAPVKVTRKSYSELLVTASRISTGGKSFCVDFVTPTAFKSAGKYISSPSSGLIFRSLLQKWNVFSADPYNSSEIDPNQIIYGIDTKVDQIVSAAYSVNGQTIPGFRSKLLVSLNGSPAMNQLNILLLCYAKFAGVGIKTALGMGGVTVTVRERVVSVCSKKQPVQVHMPG